MAIRFNFQEMSCSGNEFPPCLTSLWIYGLLVGVHGNVQFCLTTREKFNLKTHT